MKTVKIVLTEKEAVFWYLTAANIGQASDDKTTHKTCKALMKQLINKLSEECPGWNQREWERSKV